MSDDVADDDKTTASLAAEIARETAALNRLLSEYASKADVERQLIAERSKTKKAINERDRSRLVTVVACVIVTVFSVGMSVWALGVSHDAKASAKTANTALAVSQTNDERQQVVSCNDANKNRAALVSLFDYINNLSKDIAERTGRPVDQDTTDLVQFGRTTFALRDCAAEAAERAATPTTTTPGG